MERPGTVWLFLVLCAPALVSGGNHAFEVLRTANQHYQGFDFFAIEARLPSDGLSSSENWCRDYQNLCAEYGLRPTGCGESWAVNGHDNYVRRCVTEYNSDPYINNVLNCNPSGGVRNVANLAFSAGANSLRSFGFYRCTTSSCQRGIVESRNSLTYTSLAFPGDRIVYTVCTRSATACTSSPCMNAGTCQDQGLGYNCTCVTGYTGNNCDVLDMGACYQFSLHAVSYGDASQSCGAGGGYLADVRKAEQQHLIGNASTTGSDVSLWIGIKVPPVTLTYSDGSSVSDIDECASSPCQNGGSCTDGVDSFSCDCAIGYSGDFCEADELEWASSQPASPCDLCVLLDSSSNYQAITTPCGEQHNYVCQADIDECASSPCQNGGSCTDGVDSFSCECAIGYSGDFCEADIDWCTQGQGYCPFGWICEDMVTHFICHATSNNLKSLYQCDSDTCPNGMTCIAEGPGSFSCRAG
uniref:Fibropellin-1-like n=1 Tax=Branchiostoma floridae TaxID=7739 RepID=C3XZQ2_BRAFL|eukprot:XP_002610440.1 hypothetical protein BRAFLDRAFT_85579 [Branchiostoma floridae]